MTQPEMPNPVELYQRAIDYMRPILAGVQPGQLDAATPCSQWNVQQLIIHNIRGALGAHGMITGGDGVNPMDVSGPLPPEGAEAAFAAASAQVLEAMNTPGVPEKTIEAGPNRMTAAQFLFFMFAEGMLHGWDLANATGQDTSMDDSLAGACFNVLESEIEGARQMGFFGPAVEVPAEASLRDKLLGLTGRQP